MNPSAARCESLETRRLLSVAFEAAQSRIPNPSPGGAVIADLGNSEQPAEQFHELISDPTITLTSSAAVVAAGQPITFTATVGTSAILEPTGTITLLDGQTVLGTSAFRGNGFVNVGGTLEFGGLVQFGGTLPIGDHSITAVYSGDAINSASTSAALIETVSPGVGLAVAIVHSTLPQSVVYGNPTYGRVSVSISNTGSTVARGFATVQIYASPSGPFDDASILLGASQAPFAIGTNGSAPPLSVPIRSLPKSLNGSYQLYAKLFDTKGNVFFSPAGPVLSTVAPVIAFSTTLIRSTLARADYTARYTNAFVVLKFTNNCDTITSDAAEIDLYFSANGSLSGATGVRGRLARLPAKPGSSEIIVVRLSYLPIVPDGTYNLLAQVSLPNNAQTTLNVGSYALTLPVLTLVPSTGTFTPAAKGTAQVAFTLTNQGNIPCRGLSTLTLYANSDDPAFFDSQAQVVKRQVTFTLAPGHLIVLHLTLKKSDAARIVPADTLYLFVTDPLKGTQFTEFSAA